jgi:hypothetical protein
MNLLEPCEVGAFEVGNASLIHLSWRQYASLDQVAEPLRGRLLIVAVEVHRRGLVAAKS